MTPEQRGLKACWKALVERLGGIDVTASVTRVGRTHVSNYGSPNQEEMFPPVDVVLAVERAADKPLVTAQLARAQGYELVPVQAREPGRLADELARMGRDFSGLFGDAADALGGKALSPALREKMLAELADIAAVVAETVQTVRSML